MVPGLINASTRWCTSSAAKATPARDWLKKLAVAVSNAAMGEVLRARLKFL